VIGTGDPTIRARKTPNGRAVRGVAVVPQVPRGTGCRGGPQAAGRGAAHLELCVATAAGRRPSGPVTALLDLLDDFVDTDADGY
jgi:hypothetical protein